MAATKEYEIPQFGLPPARIHGWCLEAEQEGRAWLETQRPTTEWKDVLSVLSGADVGGPVLDGQSNVGYNKTERIAREIVASLANFRHEGEFKVTWDDRLYDQAHVLTDLDRNWYRTTYANEAHRAALQYAVATGTAYLTQTWDKNFWSPLRGDIKLSALSPEDVTFVQLPKSHDIQRAYAVIIREEMPINLAKATYAYDNPQFAASLVPDRDSPGWLQKGLQKVQQFLAPALRVAGRSPSQDQRASFPTVDIFHMYTVDASVNDSGAPRQMGPFKDGRAQTNWAYTVPAIGDPIPTDQINTLTGNYFTIPATHEHCRLFPLRRYTIFSRTAMGYDGPSPYWHGEVPLVRLRFRDWAWEALGRSLLGDLKTMQDGIIALMRGMEDSAAARLDPPMTYDDQMGSTWAQAVNPRRAGGRSAAPLSQIAEPIKPLLPPQYYDVPAWIPGHIEAQEARMDYQAGVNDLVAIAKAKQVPGADTLEKLMEMAGPIVEDLVRQIEHPLQKLGDQRKAMYLQFYTRARMLTVTGPEGVDLDKQYLPEQLYAIQMRRNADSGKWEPAETALQRDQRIAALKPEQRTALLRGYLDDFRYHVTESGINEIHRLSNKLLYIQLSKLGFPISWWTLARVCQIPNFGPPPEGTNTEMERWIAQKRIETDLAIDQQQDIAQGLAGAGGGAEGGVPGDEGGGGSPPPGAPGSGPDKGGRPPSFQAAPRLVQKDGGARSTITTSR
jgi:hypothetical protein